jgi:hypothetical protein
MSADNPNPDDKRRGGIDPAALAAASVAAVITTITPPGPYSSLSTVIGVTILFLIFAYDVDPDRSVGQSLAFGAVVGMVGALTLGFPLEWIFFDDPKHPRIAAFRHDLPQGQDIDYSNVPPYLIVIIWFVLAMIVFARDTYPKWRTEES